MSLIRHLRRVAWYTLITSKLPQVGATCTRWLPDAGRPDKETTSKLRDLLPQEAESWADYPWSSAPWQYTYLSNALRAGAECTDAMHAKNTKIKKRQFEF